MKPTRKHTAACTAATLLAVGLGCATSATGRKQLMLISPDQTAGMGEQAFQEMKEKGEVANDPRASQYVRCVAAKVAVGAGEPVERWEIVVFDDKSANAFALPGGKIGVHTGILEVAKTQDQLAAVLGHEIAHVTQAHVSERLSQTVVAQGGIEAVLAALGTGEGTTHDLAMGALGLGAQVGVLMPYGRLQESEADVVGLRYMARAGFDPRQAVELWKNMAAATGDGPPEFLSSHPSHESRMTGLQKNMSEALAAYQEARNQGKRPQCVARRDAVASASVAR